MSFLNALFLAGLAGVAIPVAIHLLNRERPRTLPFGWVALLNRAHRAESRRFRLREILLLILRGLLCALLALAFARPFFAGAAAEEPILPDHAVIVVDVSYSMRAGDRWQVARRQAISLIDHQPEGTRLALVAAAQVPQIVADFTTDHALLRTAVGSSLEPGYESTDLGAAFRLAEARLRAAEAGRRSLFVVSDHQAVGWQRLDPGDRAAEGIDVTLVDAGGDEANAAVTDLRSIPSDGAVGVAARLHNYGSSSRQLSVRLAVDGGVVQSKSARLPPRASADVYFENALASRPSGSVAGAWVEIDDGALDADDRRYLTLEAPRRYRVLCVVGSTAGRESAFYLLRALNPWGRSHADVERPQIVRPSGLTAEALTGVDVVFLTDTGQLPATALSNLRAFVDAGGGLVVSCGERSTLELGDLLPAATVRGRVRVPQEEGFALLTGIDYGHPLFTPFHSGRQGDFGRVRTFAYTHLRLTEPAPVLMRFDGEAPALVEHELGAGRVLLFTSAFDTTWTDLPKKALFAPFLHQALAYLSSARQPPQEELLVGLPSAASGTRFDHPGLFTDQTAAGPRLVAVNVDSREADLRRADLDEILTRLRPRSPNASNSAQPEPPGRELDDSRQLEREQRLWWWLMWGVLGLAVGEMVLANRTR